MSEAIEPRDISAANCHYEASHNGGNTEAFYAGKISFDLCRRRNGAHTSRIAGTAISRAVIWMGKNRGVQFPIFSCKITVEVNVYEATYNSLRT